MCTESRFCMEEEIIQEEGTLDKLHIDIQALSSMHRFGDILADAIGSIQSDIAGFQVIRDAKDCIGRHWYGLRCRVTCKRSGIGYYLHIGLIYFPSTRPGLMIELDEQNNHHSYGCVLENIEERPEFEINRDEPEYFKLFMPDAVFADMSGRTRKEQAVILRGFVQSGAEAIVEAAYEKGFTLDYQKMADSLNLVNAFDQVLNEMESSISSVEVNYADPDNFGQYAEGFRYYLKNKDSLSLYAYFGAIYSYKKQPAGIFAEIDKFSNQKEFDRVYDNMETSDMYELGIKEPGFIKLFMKEAMVEELNQAAYERQIEILKEFLKACNEAMVSAWERGGNR